MEVRIFSKTTFDKIMKNHKITNENVEKNHPDIFFVSINDSLGTDEVPYFENKKNVKVLYFDDVEEDIETSRGTAKAFSIEQARELFDFIESNKDKKKCVVHCSAGISRSGAVGTFINDYFKGDYFEFKKINPRIHPNGLVLRLLKQAQREKENDTN